ncbi:MAG TPA: cyanophycin synthetase, partial [Elusimicrobiota bacterium]|nr:cyanophycin synthetase [Elusimicrobiota bacterium]
LFERFRGHCRRLLDNADAPLLEGLLEGAATFGFLRGELRAEELALGARVARFRVRGVEFELPAPGRHNAENALAATAAALECGVSLEDCARALKGFRGVYRRFQSLGKARGVEVIDDYAHNPDKVRAAVAAARLRGARVLAVFQPHGFGPTRFLKNDFIESFCAALTPADRLWLAPIYYAGGTAVKDISSGDISGPVAARGLRAESAPRSDIPGAVAAFAREGDVVLVMGARDPSLGSFAKEVLAALKA